MFLILARLIYRILYLYNLLQGRKNSEIELVSMEEKAAYGMIKIKRGERVHGKIVILHTNDLHSHLEIGQGSEGFGST